MNSKLNFSVPTSLKLLSNEQLWLRTHDARKKEREALDELLELLLEVDRRSLHLDRGFDSMFTFLEKGLGYDPGSAHRRLMALRAIQKVPTVREQLKSGVVTLSAVSMAENHFRQIQKVKAVSRAERTELFAQLEGKAKNEVEGLLAEKRSEAGLTALRQLDRVRRLDRERTELQFEVDAEFMEKLTRLREIFFHRNPQADLNELLLFALQTTLKIHDPKERQARRLAREEKISKGGGIRVEPKISSGEHSFEQSAEQPVSQFGEGASLSAPLLREPRTVAAARQTSEPDRSSGLRLVPQPTEDELRHHPAFVQLPVPSEFSNQSRRPHLARSTQAEVFLRAGYRCEYRESLASERCSQKASLEIDHRRPLFQGGKHATENLQVLCWSHHRRKSLAEGPA